MGILDSVSNYGKGVVDKKKKQFNGDDFQLRNKDAYKFKDKSASGKFTRAQLQPIDDQSKKKESDKVKKVEFQYNPETVTISKKVEYKEVGSSDNKAPKQYTGGNARKISFKELKFDTFESRTSVYEQYISKLERFIHIDSEQHRPPKVLLIWGNFLAAKKGDIVSESFPCYITSLDVTYTMFLEDGTPVRATVKMTLEETRQIEDKYPVKSPDFAKVYTVRRGDTLQHIAYREYDNPAEWRRIAKTNSIDNPMNIKPGTKLLIPPILK